jgi:sensor domain CHASE-containing protein
MDQTKQMTLQRKTLLIVLITLAGLLVFLYGFVRLLVLDGFDLFEAQSSRRFAELIRGAFLASVDEVDMTSRQYAAWDETLRFVRTRDSRHIESSFSSESFAASRLSFVIIMDLNGETLFEKSFGTSETDKAIPESLRPLLGKGSPLTRHRDAHSSAKGMITLPEGVLFIASRPVVSSDMQSPVRGCFVAAKYYDDAMLAGVKRYSGVNWLSAPSTTRKCRLTSLLHAMP